MSAMLSGVHTPVIRLRERHRGEPDLTHYLELAAGHDAWACCMGARLTAPMRGGKRCVRLAGGRWGTDYRICRFQLPTAGLSVSRRVQMVRCGSLREAATRSGGSLTAGGYSEYPSFPLPPAGLPGHGRSGRGAMVHRAQC